MSALAELDVAWAEWLKPAGPGGKPSQGERWRKDNPGEWAKLLAYRQGGPRPALVSNTGRQMVCETAAWHALLTEAPFWRESFDRQPADWWQYEHAGRVTWPHTAFELAASALRLNAPAGAPGGAGVLTAIWTGSEAAHGKQGQEYWLSTAFRFSDGFDGWIVEQHENFGSSVYSNAIGITPERSLLVQRTGGLLASHPSPSGWQTRDTEHLEPGRTYRLLVHVRWSPRDDGFYRVWLDERQIAVSRQEGPTLLTDGSRVDEVALGLYAYPFAAKAAATHIEFDHLALGPTRESVLGSPA